jgi:dTDP-4-dehydrorhamnose reductase
MGGDADARAWCDAHPVLQGIGWWHSDIRLEHSPFCWRPKVAKRAPSQTRPILITGKTGTLGQAFAGACRLRGLSHILSDRRMMAIDDRSRSPGCSTSTSPGR